ncbi:hypothetical protein SNL152K_9022 [Streptomyces sp. NL15-2K]|nr:hypothetical protein SNL152K_9022 [Streptomyces sp. NL15-2K]
MSRDGRSRKGRRAGAHEVSRAWRDRGSRRRGRRRGRDA